MPKASMTDLPYMPKPDASQKELYECMGDLVIWALDQRLGQLMNAGLRADELVKLRTMAVRFQKGTTNIGDLNALRKMLPKLEQVHITKPKSD